MKQGKFLEFGYAEDKPFLDEAALSSAANGVREPRQSRKVQCLNSCLKLTISLTHLLGAVIIKKNVLAAFAADVFFVNPNSLQVSEVIRWIFFGLAAAMG